MGKAEQAPTKGVKAALPTALATHQMRKAVEEAFTDRHLIHASPQSIDTTEKEKLGKERGRKEEEILLQLK